MGNDSKKLKKYLRKKLNYNSWKQLLEFMKFPRNIEKLSSTGFLKLLFWNSQKAPTKIS